MTITLLHKFRSYKRRIGAHSGSVLGWCFPVEFSKVMKDSFQLQYNEACNIHCSDRPLENTCNSHGCIVCRKCTSPVDMDTLIRPFVHQEFFLLGEHAVEMS